MENTLRSSWQSTFYTKKHADQIYIRHLSFTGFLTSFLHFALTLQSCRDSYHSFQTHDRDTPVFHSHSAQSVFSVFICSHLKSLPENVWCLMETASCWNLPATFSIRPLLVCCANLTAGHTKKKFLMRRHASVPLPQGTSRWSATTWWTHTTCCCALSTLCSPTLCCATPGKSCLTPTSEVATPRKTSS